MYKKGLSPRVRSQPGTEAYPGLWHGSISACAEPTLCNIDAQVNKNLPSCVQNCKASGLCGTSFMHEPV